MGDLVSLRTKKMEQVPPGFECQQGTESALPRITGEKILMQNKLQSDYYRTDRWPGVLFRFLWNKVWWVASCGSLNADSPWRGAAGSVASQNSALAVVTRASPVTPSFPFPREWRFYSRTLGWFLSTLSPFFETKVSLCSLGWTQTWRLAYLGLQSVELRTCTANPPLAHTEEHFINGFMIWGLA